ncbi:hypothetical protein DL93DRAFT_2069142, partial [Clavulina sp. PMI_390]
MKHIRSSYKDDPLFRKILSNPTHHRSFELRDGLILFHPSASDSALCIPDSVFQGRRAREIIIDLAHTTVGHLAALRTGELIRRSYWW